MKCSEAERFWEEWLEGRPAPEFERHLEQCRSCREQTELLVQTRRWLGLLQQEPPPLPASFWIGLRTRLEEREARASFWRGLELAARGAVAALVLVVLLLSVWLASSSSESALADFDAPQTYWEELVEASPAANGNLYRDQVMLTLIPQEEPSP